MFTKGNCTKTFLPTNSSNIVSSWMENEEWKMEGDMGICFVWSWHEKRNDAYCLLFTECKLFCIKLFSFLSSFLRTKYFPLLLKMKWFPFVECIPTFRISHFLILFELFVMKWGQYVISEHWIPNDEHCLNNMFLLLCSHFVPDFWRIHIDSNVN